MTGDEKTALLRQAIREGRPVTAMGSGLRREFCPHLLGTKRHPDGRARWHVLAWQFDGASRSGLPSGGGWRCFDLAFLDMLRLRDGPWHRGSRTGAAEQTCIDSIDCAVDPSLAAPANG